MLKTIFITILFTSVAHARQYIQCSSPDAQSSDVMVLNLTTEMEGTLLISSGVENPENERILVSITFEKTEMGHHVYKVINEGGEGSVRVPSPVIGASSDSFIIGLLFAGYQFDFSCFSRIYND